MFWPKEHIKKGTARCNNPNCAISEIVHIQRVGFPLGTLFAHWITRYQKLIAAMLDCCSFIVTWKIVIVLKKCCIFYILLNKTRFWGKIC